MYLHAAASFFLGPHLVQHLPLFNRWRLREVQRPRQSRELHGANPRISAVEFCPFIRSWSLITHHKTQHKDAENEPTQIMSTFLHPTSGTITLQLRFRKLDSLDASCRSPYSMPHSLPSARFELSWATWLVWLVKTLSFDGQHQAIFGGSYGCSPQKWYRLVS